MKVAAIHYSYYPQDTRPRREAEALVDAGMSVDIICLRLPEQISTEKINGVQVNRIPVQRNREGKLSYLFKYAEFFFRALFRLSITHLRKRFDVIHIHNMPDFLVFTALLPKLTGSKIVLDLHDPMPELYMTKYSIHEGSSVIKVLKMFERWSIVFADVVITPNLAFRNLFISRGCPPEKIHIVMNSPMEKIFLKKSVEDSGVAHEDSREFVLMFHGGIYERHGLDTALEAISMLVSKIPNIMFKVFGEGEYVAQFTELVDRFNLKSNVKFYGVVSLETISNEIRSIDIGLIPNKKNPFTDLNFPVRIFEYLCLHKPVVVPKTQGIMDYFDDESIFFFEPGNAMSLCDTILTVHSDDERRKKVIENGIKVYNNYRWELQREHFVANVTALLDDNIQSSN